MNISKIISGKGRIILWGSLIGGVVGSLLMQINELVGSTGQSTLGLEMGPLLTTALGMIGGLIGGAMGSFIAGAIVHEKIFINIGSSMGIGLVNGFISGTIAGVAIGYLRLYKPELVTTATLGALIALTIIPLILFRPSRVNTRRN